ncbi:putative G-protein coupled receptor F59B2.13 [Bactrocera oleae]|uniref:putative G-protein coupled receptor F59B2.13 n=1 Tax=Bactrocera oleae TaxID=104688 RepID=UPI00387E5EBC
MQCIVGFNNNIENATEFILTLKNINANDLFLPDKICVWKRAEPTLTAYVIYAFIVPVLSCFGLCANFINAMVFMRPKMTPSAFSYLAALALLDCFSCLLILFTALSRSIFFNIHFWVAYDFQWQTPLFGISTGAANLLLGSVSCDRWIYLNYGVVNGCGPPRFCRCKVARRIIIMVIIISVILNLPYFFIFVVNDDDTFITHKLYYTTYYKIHNWCSFILLTLLPAIFLTIGNIAIIVAFRRWTKQSKKCQRYGNNNAKTAKKRYQHQLKLTITIIILIVLYMIGELPAALTSRKNALNLLFGGDLSRVNFGLMAKVDMICLTLNALQLSINILVYAVINPSFMPEFFECLRAASDFCCNILCCCCIHCSRCFCFTTHQTSSQTENVVAKCGCEHATVDGRIECDCETQQMEVRKSAIKRCDVSSAGTNGNWDTNPKDVGDMPGFDLYRYWRNSVTTPHTPNRYRFSSEHGVHKHEQVWSTDMDTWKRSSSFGEYAFDNLALEIGTAIEEVTHNFLEEHARAEASEGSTEIAAKQTEGHSLAF